MFRKFILENKSAWMLAFIAVFASATARATAQCQTLRKELTNPNPTTGDEYGIAVAISGNKAVVGADRDDTAGDEAGIAYLFDTVTGARLQTFTNPTPAQLDLFGWSVAIWGDLIVIGAPQDDTGALDAGSAYLFDGTNGALLRVFNNPTPGHGDWFGHSVSIYGTNILIGAQYDDTVATDTGAAYLFDALTGNLVQTYNNPTPATEDRFGLSVAISGNYVVAGAHWDDTGGNDVGSAYLFNATTGELLHTFNNPFPAPDDRFGRSVAISGNNILIAADYDDGGATDGGNAYLYDAQSGSLLRTISNPSPTFEDRFGYSISVSNDLILIGAVFNDAGAMNAGSAYLFSALTGELLRTFDSPTPVASDHFGISVGISGDSVIVGAALDDTGAINAGNAFLYACPPCGDVTADGVTDVADIVHQVLGRP